MKNETNWLIILEACDGTRAYGFATLDEATAFARKYIKSLPNAQIHMDVSDYGTKVEVMPIAAFYELVQGGEMPKIEIEA